MATRLHLCTNVQTSAASVARIYHAAHPHDINTGCAMGLLLPPSHRDSQGTKYHVLAQTAHGTPSQCIKAFREFHLLVQMETAALKAASDSRNKVFVRKVTAVYTPATLEAGVFADSVVDDAEDEQPADVTPSYLFAVSERQSSGNQTGAATHLSDQLGSVAVNRDSQEAVQDIAYTSVVHRFTQYCTGCAAM